MIAILGSEIILTSYSRYFSFTLSLTKTGETAKPNHSRYHPVFYNSLWYQSWTGFADYCVQEIGAGY